MFILFQEMTSCVCRVWRMSKFLIAARLLVYTLGLGRLLYWHTLQMYKTLVFPEAKCAVLFSPLPLLPTQLSEELR